MPAGVHNFTIEQGATWSRDLTIKNPDGTPMNLTGFSARMQVRKDVDANTTLVELSTTNGLITVTPLLGKLTLTLDAASTGSLTKGGVYDLEIISGGGEVTRIIEGQVVLKKNVTR